MGNPFEDLWTNTPLDMERNAGVDSQGCGSSSNESAEFVNSGLVLWNQTRQQWLGSKRSKSCRKGFVQKPILNENVIYESLLGSNKRFTKPIPLEEMVQFLVKVWDGEGLYG